MELLNNNADKQEFTLKELVALIKKSGMRILIYCVIAAILMSVISVGIYFGARDSADTVMAVIEYSYEGASEGRLPNSEQPLVAANIKSSEIIDAAIQSVKTSGINIRATVSEIASRTSVLGKIPGNIQAKINAGEDINYIPTQYEVQFSDFKSLGMNADVARNVLNSMVEQYSASFLKKYIKADLIPVSNLDSTISGEVFGTGVSQRDYLQVCEDLSARLVEAISVLTQYQTMDSFWSSSINKLRFSDIAARLRTISEGDLAWVEFFITSNGISEDPTRLIGYYTEQRNILATRKAGTDSLITKLKEQLDNYKHGSMTMETPSGNMVLTEIVSEEYNRQYARITEIIQESNRYETQIELYRNYIITFGGTVDDEPAGSAPSLSITKTEEQKAIDRITAKAELVELASIMQEEFVLANAVIEEFSRSVLGRSISVPLAAVQIQPINNLFTILMIASILVLVAAAVIAVTVTKWRGAMVIKRQPSWKAYIPAASDSQTDVSSETTPSDKD